MAKEKEVLGAKEVVEHCETLGELAFDVHANSAYAYNLRVLELSDRGVAYGDVVAYAHFSMSYSAFQMMKHFYRQNHAMLRCPQIDAFLRSYREFSSVFSSGWVLSIGVEPLRERFEKLDEAYGDLAGMLRETAAAARVRCR